MTGILEGEESIVGPTAIFVPAWCMEGEGFASTRELGIELAWERLNRTK